MMVNCKSTQRFFNCSRLTLFVTAFSGFGMVACAAAEPTPLPEGSWGDHGFTQSQRDRIHSVFQQGIDRKAIPGGALLIIHEGEVVLREAFGVADIETNRPFRVDSPCRIASLTKPHTATMLVLLSQQGLLSLNEPVDTYLPEFQGIKVRDEGPAKHAPTIAECLSHTAGFPGNNALKSGRFSVDFDNSLKDTIEDLATQELLAAPGTRYAYSRLGFMTAARVAEVVTNKTFPDLMREVLLLPIGANDATFFPAGEFESRMPVPYERTKQGFKLRVGDPLGKIINPGGSLISTLDDVARLMLLHRNRGEVGGKKLVSAEDLTQMYVPQPGTTGTGYGLGFNIMKKREDGTASRIRHTGAAGTLAVLDFDKDLIFIVLTQVPQQQTLGWRSQLVKAIDQVVSQ